MQMANKKTTINVNGQNLDEYFDNLFKQLDSDDVNVVNQSITDFGKAVKSGVDRSVRGDGYDTIESFLSHKISGKKTTRPQVSDAPVSGSTRYDYFMDILNNVDYREGFRGNYMEGHQRILDMFKEKASFCQEDLSKLDRDIAEARQSYRGNNRRDAYIRGCMDGIDYVEKALKKSKLYMMTRIKEELAQEYTLCYPKEE